MNDLIIIKEDSLAPQIFYFSFALFITKYCFLFLLHFLKIKKKFIDWSLVYYEKMKKTFIFGIFI